MFEMCHRSDVNVLLSESSVSEYEEYPANVPFFAVYGA